MQNILSPLLTQILFAVASLVIIMISAGRIIYAASDYAKKTGVSDYLIGFLVVSVGTSLPELTIVGRYYWSQHHRCNYGFRVNRNNRQKDIHTW